MLSLLKRFWAFLSAPERPKSYPLPKCPQCGSPAWVKGQKYLHERWFGTGVQTYMLAKCVQCGLNVKFRFEETNYDILHRKGWYFE